MRIEFVLNTLTKGGAETQVVRIACALQQRGHSVGVTTLLPNVAYEDTLAAAEVGVTKFDLSGRLGALFGLMNAVRHLRAIHADVAVPFLFSAECVVRLSRFLGAGHRVISAIRNEDIGGRQREVILRFSSFLTDEWMTNSSAVAQRLSKRRAFGNRSFRVIPNGLDFSHLLPIPRARESAREEAGVVDSDFIWIAVGSQRPQKNYQELIKAFSRTRKNGDYLWIVGDGFQQAELSAVAAAASVSQFVRFWGARDDVPRLLQAADAFVLASLHEGSPNALLEAAASGLATVATDVGGVSELLTHGKTGLLVPAYDTSALESAMRELRGFDVNQRRQMGENGQRLTSKHNLPAVVDQWEALLFEVCRQEAR